MIMDYINESESLFQRPGVMWFQRMKLLARLGVVGEIPELRQQVEVLRERLEAQGGWFTKPLTHDYFRRWAPTLARLPSS
jgi:hypothetical protein